MAITQQLARLDSLLLRDILSDAEKLDNLVSFTLLPQFQYLDIGWNGEAIRKIIHAAFNLDIDQIDKALDGQLEFAKFSDGFFVEDNPKYLLNQDVVVVNNFISSLNFEEAISKIESKGSLIDFLNMDYDGYPRDLIEKEFRFLTDFYQRAANEGQCVVCWWD